MLDKVHPRTLNTTQRGPTVSEWHRLAICNLTRTRVLLILAPLVKSMGSRRLVILMAFGHWGGSSPLRLFDKVEREKRNAGGGVLAVRGPCSHGSRMLRDFRPILRFGPSTRLCAAQAVHLVRLWDPS